MNAAPELDLAGFTYRIGKLPAKTQFHLARKLAPVVSTLGTAVSQLGGSGAEQSQEQWIVTALGPVTEVVAGMSETDVNFIIDTSLSVVSRRQDDGRYAPIQRNGNLMFIDIEMPTMFRLVVETIKENLGSFFAEVVGGL